MTTKKIILIICIICAATYIYITFPRKINKTYYGIEYKIGNKEYISKVYIEISGHYYNKVFSNDRFKGIIKIDSTNLSGLDLELDNNKGAWLLGIDNKTGEWMNYGFMFTDTSWSKVTIGKFQERDSAEKKGWNSRNGIIISAPANKRKEAINITNELMEGSFQMPDKIE